MDISMKALRSYVEKIAKLVLKDESSKPVVVGTIKSSLPGYYEVQLVNGNETSLVRAESLYADKVFAKDDYVYLVRAEVARGEEYDTKYFIVGLVTNIEQNYANLTDNERFLGDGQIIKNLAVLEENNSSVTVADEKFINAIRANGVFSFSAIVTTEIANSQDFGLLFTLTFDEGEPQKIKFPGITFVGQPWNLKGVKQKKVFDIGKNNKLKQVEITLYKNSFIDGDIFEVAEIQLESGTFINLVNDFTVELENISNRNYFNKENDNGIVQIKANVKYGNQKLDTTALKYYWFVKEKDPDIILKQEDYLIAFKEAQEAIEKGNLEEEIINSKTNDILIDKVNEALQQPDLELQSEKILLALKNAIEKKYENSLGGEGWRCLNESSPIKYVEDEKIVTDDRTLIYKTSNNTLTIDYDKANTNNWLPHYENEIKCVVGYQLANATSDPIKVYNFKHEDYDIEIKFDEDTSLPLLFLTDTATITAHLSSQLVGLDYNKVTYRWYLEDDLENALGYEKDGGTTFYSSSMLTVGFPNKSSESCYRLEKEFGYFVCKAFRVLENEELEELATSPNSLRVWSKINAEDKLETVTHYCYWVENSSDIIFTKAVAEKDLPDGESKDFYTYYLSGETEGILISDINEDGLAWLKESNEPFGEKENGKYYLFYSAQVQVRDVANPEKIYRYDDFSKPQIIRCVDKIDDNIIDLLTEAGIEQLNTFNNLTNNGQSEGIYYKDADYIKTGDEAPDSNKLKTGQGYYALVEENGQKKYVLREQNSDNYEMSNDQPLNFIAGQDYYEQLSKGDLYINASFIRSGYLEVGNGEEKIFTADMDNKAVTIGGFHVKEDHLASGDPIESDPHSVLVSKGYGEKDAQSAQFAFWAGNKANGSSDETRPFWVKNDGSAQFKKITVGNNNLSTDNNGNLLINTDPLTLSIVDGKYKLTVQGDFEAKGGIIGGFHIAESYLGAGEGNLVKDYNVMLSGKGLDPVNPVVALGAGAQNEVPLCFWAGPGSTGKEKPFSIDFDGNIKATGGTIGGWTIGPNSLVSTNSSIQLTGDHQETFLSNGFLVTENIANKDLKVSILPNEIHIGSYSAQLGNLKIRTNVNIEGANYNNLISTTNDQLHFLVKNSTPFYLNSGEKPGLYCGNRKVTHSIECGEIDITSNNNSNWTSAPIKYNLIGDVKVFTSFYNMGDAETANNYTRVTDISTEGATVHWRTSATSSSGGIIAKIIWLAIGT